MVATSSGSLLSTALTRVPPSHGDQSAARTPAPAAGVGADVPAVAARDAHRVLLAGLALRASDRANPDQRAFDQLATHLRPAFAAFFREKARAKEDLIEDLTQRALLGLWQALSQGRYDPTRSAVTTFAYAIGHKVWLQHLRATGRRDAAMDRYTRLVAQGGPANPQAESLAEESSHAALLEAMRGALAEGESPASLTDDERWLLRNWAGGQSDRELARVMGIAASNVNVRKQRAYAKIREYLHRMGLSHQEPA
jgi:RNA polymerase sigma factor (sigma-70 family)